MQGKAYRKEGRAFRKWQSSWTRNYEADVCFISHLINLSLVNVFKNVWSRKEDETASGLSLLRSIDI